MMKQENIVEACGGLAVSLQAGQTVTVVDLDGKQVVDFFAVSASDPKEFLSTGVTIDCNESLRLKAGDRIYTNLYRAMFTLIADEVGEHDLLNPCCRKEMYDFFYHNGNGHPNCLDNMNESLGESRAMIHPVNLFMRTKINPDGSILVDTPISKAGDKVVLRALMDVRVGVAACSVSESRCNGRKCSPVQIIIEG